MAKMCKFRGMCGIFGHVMKIDGSLAQNIGFGVADFGVTKCENLGKSRPKCSF